MYWLYQGAAKDIRQYMQVYTHTYITSTDICSKQTDHLYNYIILLFRNQPSHCLVESHWDMFRADTSCPSLEKISLQQKVIVTLEWDLNISFQCNLPTLCNLQYYISSILSIIPPKSTMSTQWKVDVNGTNLQSTHTTEQKLEISIHMLSIFHIDFALNKIYTFLLYTVIKTTTFSVTKSLS